ncbi:hypothetical protein ACOQJR_11170 [Klebsiella pneumoniae]|uniref:hypothetical protein n=1 Tax=Klebsiella pneumoniae TaxID=573 RepID=UPI000807C081|nr:hypothetical protein [Klebsiella pneumoniae]MBX9006387.1 hypothetical protein [Klebsiella pneumoniae]SBW63397.1 morphogenetic protein [Klebsiella pneumoniae]SBY32003.1 morphogenetic protein [Klebsiella pneumoniae]HCC6224998.1 hypothetical protein [Klebsiella pneumoniae]
MTERGMIFNGEMVRALLDGRKTQTRRPIKWKQTRFTEIGEREDGSKWPWSEDAEHACDFWHPCPFGAVGDRIWVRETWAEAGASAPDLKLYRANYPEHVPSIYENVPPAEEIRWTPSIHMPRWASRILLEITDVRVERLNSIHDVDAMREGIQNLTTCSHADFGIPGVVNAQHPVRAFQLLWESIHGADSWRANPWVWVIEFKRVEGGAA